jgi:hypothetical protein
MAWKAPAKTAGQFETTPLPHERINESRLTLSSLERPCVGALFLLKQTIGKFAGRRSAPCHTISQNLELNCRFFPETSKIAAMGKAEIIAELPHLRAEERQQVLERLCELQEQDILSSAGPSDDEKRLLDRELTEFEKDGNGGRPWRDVLREIRARRAS